MNLPVKRLCETARIPTRGHDEDAGLDLYLSEDRTILPGQFLDVPTGIAIELPPGTWGMLVGRSSTLRRLGLMVQMGVIDEGYRGELFIACWNLSGQPVEVHAGERLGQIILHQNTTFGYDPVEVEELRGSSRGTGGFGSTGV